MVEYLSSLLDLEAMGPARWDFNLQYTGQVLAISQKRAVIISNTSSMYDAFVQLSKGIGRLMVVDCPCEVHDQTEEESGILGMFTQSDIIRFLGQNPYWLQLCSNGLKTLEELGIFQNPFEELVMVDQTQSASFAFKKITETAASGLAVVDSDGKLVAVVTSSNIRGISRRNFQLLRLPLHEFLQKDRSRGWWTMPMFLRRSDTLEKAILQFSSSRVHQMFVLDESGCPKHVVTLTDLLRKLF